MQKILLSGLVVLLPFVITIYFFLWAIEIASIPFYPLAKYILNLDPIKNTLEIENSQLLLVIFTRVFAVIFLVILSYFLGLVAHSFFNKYLIEKPLKLIKKIPIIGKLFSFTYNVSLKLTDAAHPDFFKETVLFPFFHKDKQVLGIVTKKTAPDFIPKNLHLDTVLFIPTSPHPVSGFLVFCSNKDLTKTSIHPEEALEYVIAMGADEQSSQLK